MKTPAVTAEEIATAERDAAKIKAAKVALVSATQSLREAERLAEAAREEVARREGFLACAIADAVAHGADPALVLPLGMPPRVITASALDTRLRDGSGGFSATGSRFSGWMKITVGGYLDFYIPSPRYFDWSDMVEKRREAAKRRAGK